MIVYRKGAGLRLKRASFPQPPFWAASTIAPYSARRGTAVSIDYGDLRASYAEKLEVSVCDAVTDTMERSGSRLAAPVLIEATEFAETVFGRGAEALEACAAMGLPAMHLISTRGDLPSSLPGDSLVVIAAWPLELERLETLFASAKERGLRWGLAVPVIFPVTTDLVALDQLITAARTHAALFAASLAIELDPTAKQSLASSLALQGDDETFEMLFHANLEPLHTATERHIAALAHERGLEDFLLPPRWDAKTNWNASIVLTLVATRMMAMERDVELAGTIARSARVVAELEKPLVRIAEAASLSIVEAIDEVSVDILSDWVSGGRSPFVDRMNEEWRLRRDAGMAE